jgi:hypothetical protein
MKNRKELIELLNKLADEIRDEEPNTAIVGWSRW